MKKLRHLIVQLRDSDMEEELMPSTEIIEILKPLVDEIGKTSFAESWEEYQEELRKCSFEALSFFLSDAAKKLSMGEVLASFTNCIFWNMEFYEYPDGSGYEGRFTKCGICVLMKELGLYDLTPALCHLDYTMSEAGGVTNFVRQYTLASGGPYCDCGYKKKGYR